MLAVDLCICSTATTDGELIRSIKSLLMKLDMFSMLAMNTPTAIATNIMVEAVALLKTATVFRVLATRPPASWITMTSKCVVIQGNSWDGAKTKTSH